MSVIEAVAVKEPAVELPAVGLVAKEPSGLFQGRLSASPTIRPEILSPSLVITTEARY